MLLIQRFKINIIYVINTSCGQFAYLFSLILNLSYSKQMGVIFYILEIHVQCTDFSAVRQQTAEQILRHFSTVSFFFLAFIPYCLELMYHPFWKITIWYIVTKIYMLREVVCLFFSTLSLPLLCPLGGLLPLVLIYYLIFYVFFFLFSQAKDSTVLPFIILLHPGDEVNNTEFQTKQKVLMKYVLTSVHQSLNPSFR